MKLINPPPHRHGSGGSIGILLVNLGTPEAPTAQAVRPYLRRFLSDPRVVEGPRWLWWLVLNSVILTRRPPRTAAAYAKIWDTTHGSPLLTISRRQQQALQTALDAAMPAVRVELAMSYSAPLIRTALRTLQQHDCRWLLVLPLYPQYASSTVGSVFADVCAELSRWRRVPHLRFISGYGDDPRYIRALAARIDAARQQHGAADKLIFSFHGTPLQMLTDGDPYHCLCHKTARLTAAALHLADTEWLVTFQSRFGRAEWLQPYTDEVLAALPKQGVKRVQVVCPAFAADCLETLEEIAQESREVFMQAGGEHYAYLPALNDAPAHIAFLRELVQDATADWQAAQARDAANLEAQQSAYETLNS